jgi:DNA-binding transcriptional LysR family regulator
MSPSQPYLGKFVISSRSSGSSFSIASDGALVLTGEGEQLLNDCRSLLNCAKAIGERAQLLQRGDTGMLKVAASPQHIESVFAKFPPRYAQR